MARQALEPGQAAQLVGPQLAFEGGGLGDGLVWQDLEILQGSPKVTGHLHLDGLADTWDAGRAREGGGQGIALGHAFEARSGAGLDDGADLLEGLGIQRHPLALPGHQGVLEAGHLGEVLDAESIVAEHERPVGADAALQTRLGQGAGVHRAAGPQAHLGAEPLGAAEVRQALGDVDQEASLFQLRSAPGEEAPGLRGPQHQILGLLAGEGPFQGREEGCGAGQASQQGLAGLQHGRLCGGFPELGHTDVGTGFSLQAHLEDPALFGQAIRVLHGLGGEGHRRGLQTQAGTQPLGPRALAPLGQLLTQGALGDADGGEFRQLVAQGHHDALVPGQTVPLVAPQAVDEAEAGIVPGPQAARHEAHDEVRAILQEGGQHSIRGRRHGQVVLDVEGVQIAQGHGLGEAPGVGFREGHRGWRHGLRELAEGQAVRGAGEADAPAGLPGIAAGVQLGQDGATHHQGLEEAEHGGPVAEGGAGRAGVQGQGGEPGIGPLPAQGHGVHFDQGTVG